MQFIVDIIFAASIKWHYVVSPPVRLWGKIKLYVVLAILGPVFQSVKRDPAFSSFNKEHASKCPAFCIDDKKVNREPVDYTCAQNGAALRRVISDGRTYTSTFGKQVWSIVFTSPQCADAQILEGMRRGAGV